VIFATNERETIALPLSFAPPALLTGARWSQIEHFYPTDKIRQIEKASIREFMEKYRHFLRGRVADFGAGLQPYRDLVGGEYFPMQEGDLFPPALLDAVMCNQVAQYLGDPAATFQEIASRLRRGGRLVMTYPTNWDEVEGNDYWRFTKAGMERLLKAVGLSVIAHELRAEVRVNNFRFPLGYGVVAQKPYTPGPDASAKILAEMVRRRVPFFFIRYGDGAIECIRGLGRGSTRDGEEYSPALGKLLLDAWNSVIGSPGAVVGDWRSASFDARSEYSRYTEEYEQLLGDAHPLLLHFESLLLMRESEELVDFYRAVKEDPRKKLFMGPAGNAGAAAMLGAEFLEVPMTNLLLHTGRLSDELITRDFDVLLYGAGMAGTIPAARCFQKFPQRTFINLGSAMDPLFRGTTRRQQLTTARARALFAELM